MASAVVIVSKDKDFSAAVAEQVKRDVALDCDSSDSAVPADAAVVVTTGEGKFSCPVVAVKDPPVRMRDVLEEIAAALPAEEDIALGRGCVLHLRKKQLVLSGKSADVTDKET